MDILDEIQKLSNKILFSHLMCYKIMTSCFVKIAKRQETGIECIVKE